MLSPNKARQTVADIIIATEPDQPPAAAAAAAPLQPFRVLELLHLRANIIARGGGRPEDAARAAVQGLAGPGG